MDKNTQYKRSLSESRKQVKPYRIKEDVRTSTKNHLYLKNEMYRKKKVVKFIK